MRISLSLSLSKQTHHLFGTRPALIKMEHVQLWWQVNQGGTRPAMVTESPTTNTWRHIVIAVDFFDEFIFSTLRRQVSDRDPASASSQRCRRLWGCCSTTSPACRGRQRIPFQFKKKIFIYSDDISDQHNQEEDLRSLQRLEPVPQRKRVAVQLVFLFPRCCYPFDFCKCFPQPPVFLLPVGFSVLLFMLGEKFIA